MSLKDISENDWLHTDFGYDNNVSLVVTLPNHVIKYSPTSAYSIKAFAFHFFDALYALTLKALITTAADDIHKYFFIVFQRK